MDSAAEHAVRALYRQLLQAWNGRDAAAYAAGFEETGELVGFDGSTVSDREEIARHLQAVFAQHITPTYVGKVQRLRFLTPDVALLRAVAGLVPPGQSDLDPRLHAVQSLVVVRHDGVWRIAWFQNTPAQFHGRPELVEALTEELRPLL